MTREEAQSVIMTEQKCVNRANCNRDRANCDLVMDDAVINEALNMAIKALEQPERTCVNCGRRCPIKEHYALPKYGFCHLWEKRNVTDDDGPERRTDERI